MNEKKNLKGIGGWLILVGIGVVISPFRLLSEFGPVFYEVFTDGSFEYLSTPGSDGYHPLWAPLIMMELSYNSIVFVLSTLLIVLFFKCNHLFPRLFIALSVASLLFLILDEWLITYVIDYEILSDPASLKGLTRSLLAVLIWVPYMLVSKRVKSTFVEVMPSRSGKRAEASLQADN